jgi:steroid 5-alpha reductase family enzyme
MIYDHRLLNDLIFGPMISLFVFFHLVYILAIWKKDYGIVDIAWGLGFIVVVLSASTLNRSIDTRTGLLILMVSLWGLRLSTYLLMRNLKKGQEDFRYREMRNSWGKWANVHAYFKIFWLQPVILIAISFGFMVTVSRSTIPLNFLDAIGLIIASTGLIIETLADRQMNNFKKRSENKGKLIREGLWKWARHPNYFGEMVFWWGMGFFALNSVLPMAAFNGGFLISLFLIKVSGAPLLEARYKDHPDYEVYRKETNAFLPLQWRG